MMDEFGDDLLDWELWDDYDEEFDYLLSARYDDWGMRY